MILTSMLASSSAFATVQGSVVATIVIVVVVLFAATARACMIVVTEYSRAVLFRFGRVLGQPRGPGLVRRIPVVDRVVKVNLRVEVIDIPSQNVITQDNVTIAVDAVVYFQVVDPVRAVIGVDNFRFASQRIAMTSLRSIIGRYELDSLLAHREDVNAELRATIVRSTTEWGVDVRQVEVRDIQLPPELLRAMARQAEAERERRAKVIAATGELQASVELGEAADKLTASPGALQLRTLQTLAEIATEKNSTLVFPIPVELFEVFSRGVARGADSRPADRRPIEERPADRAGGESGS
ncbi:MAG: slipin family protein [Actinomycetota bacterium]|nr:slipin family protein [Actinomycetota bacterium]MDQ6945847.1 slipin family protein [Actinomycetota bacterium]